jgi:CRP-like cAMP-binding protein
MLASLASPDRPGPTPAKSALRGLLCRDAERLGLTTSAIEALVAHSQMTCWRSGQTIFGTGDASGLVSFLVAGIVKVVCPGRRSVPMVVQFVRPGRFITTGGLLDRRARERRFGAVAHTSALVAMVSQEVVTEVIAALPPDRALHLSSYGWRAFSHLLHEKCLLLTMPLHDRLTHVLRVLARDFGRPSADGVLIDLPLTHRDLAQLAVGTRANVSRCVEKLLRQGRLTVVERRLVLREPGRA